MLPRTCNCTCLQMAHITQTSYLCIELHVGGAQADKAGEEGLIQVAVLLEGHVLHHGRQLVVVSYKNHPLQPRHPIVLLLHCHTMKPCQGQSYGTSEASELQRYDTKAYDTRLLHARMQVSYQ